MVLAYVREGDRMLVRQWFPTERDAWAALDLWCCSGDFPDNVTYGMAGSSGG